MKKQKHIKNLIQGVKKVLVLDPSGNYTYPSRNGFHQDICTLREDTKRVSQDMYTTTQKYGQQIQNS